MAPFKQTNPDDNPQPGDPGWQGQDPHDRPRGITGVDKPHGGGSDALEQMADSRRGVRDASQVSGPNPNNPDSPTNPSSTAEKDLAFQNPERRVLANPSVAVTTYPTPTQNELKRFAEEHPDVKADSREGKDILRKMREDDEREAAEKAAKEAEEREDERKRRQEKAAERAREAAEKAKQREDKAADDRDRARRENEAKQRGQFSGSGAGTFTQGERMVPRQEGQGPGEDRSQHGDAMRRSGQDPSRNAGQSGQIGSGGPNFGQGDASRGRGDNSVG